MGVSLLVFYLPIGGTWFCSAVQETQAIFYIVFMGVKFIIRSLAEIF
jgi:hypothetical protein